MAALREYTICSERDTCSNVVTAVSKFDCVRWRRLSIFGSSMSADANVGESGRSGEDGAAWYDECWHETGRSERRDEKREDGRKMGG